MRGFAFLDTVRPKFQTWLDEAHDIDDPNYEHCGHEQVETAFRRGETVSDIADDIAREQEERNYRN